MRVNASMTLIMLISMGLTWYLGSDTCTNYAVTWFGVPSVSLVIIAAQVRPHSRHPPHSRPCAAPSASTCSGWYPMLVQSGSVHTESGYTGQRPRMCGMRPRRLVHSSARQSLCRHRASRTEFWPCCRVAFPSRQPRRLAMLSRSGGCGRERTARPPRPASPHGHATPPQRSHACGCSAPPFAGHG